MSEFIERYIHPEVAIDTQLNKRLQHQMECNQEINKSLLKIVIFVESKVWLIVDIVTI